VEVTSVDLLTEDVSAELMTIVDAFFAAEERAIANGVRRAVLHAALVDAWRVRAAEHLSDATALTEWKRRAEIAEAEVNRLRGHFSAAYTAAVDAARVFEDAQRWWR
jgi:hypothetical protein